MQNAIVVLPYGNFALAKIHHPATSRADVVERMHQRLAIAALVEFLGNLAVWIVNRGPCGLLAENLFSNENPRRRAVAYAPRIESGRNVDIWRPGGRTDKRQAIGTIVVLIDPPPGRIADPQVPSRPRVELAEMLGHIALQARSEF